MDKNINDELIKIIISSSEVELLENPKYKELNKKYNELFEQIEAIIPEDKKNLLFELDSIIVKMESVEQKNIASHSFQAIFELFGV